MNSNPHTPAFAAGAAPSGQPSSNASSAPAPHPGPPGQNGQPPRRRRRPPPTDPMRPASRPLKSVARPMMSMTEMNKYVGNSRSSGVEEGVPVQKLREEYIQKGAISVPLVMRRSDMKNLRYHIMRLQAKNRLDIQNSDQFTPPIRLHRRDPRAPPSGAGSHFQEEEDEEDMEESKERERLEMNKEERRKIREENQAKIAPTGTKKPPAFQKKIEQKFRPDDTPEAEKRRLLKYEETLPWHLEDFENKQTWIGVYESELSDAHLMLTTAYEPGRGDSIRMVPVGRWYKFNVKNNFKSITAEEADEVFKQDSKLPTWLVKKEQQSYLEQRTALEWKEKRGVKARPQGGDADEGGTFQIKRDDDDVPYIKREADADDIDFNMEENFADDEEGVNGLFEGDEADVKDAQERLKRDQLAASAFDLRNEEDIFREEERQREEAEKTRKLEKAIRKQLAKREKADVWDSDNSNPYESSSSEWESGSEAEREKVKQEEEQRKAAEQNGKGDAANLASGSSTKGSNTPSGVHKSVDLNKKKRPGSPNLSDASGNESSRKKHKKNRDKHGKSLLNGSDGELTDAAKSKKPKLKFKMGGSPSGTPGGSRAGSPAPSQLNGSRAGSPAGPGGAASPPPLPTYKEVYEAIPPGGMAINQLIAKFRGRIHSSRTQEFIRMVKAVTIFDAGRKWLTPRPELPSEAEILAAMRPPGKAASPPAS